MNYFRTSVALTALIATALPAYAAEAVTKPAPGTGVEAASQLTGTATEPNQSDDKEISSQAAAPEVQVKQDASEAEMTKQDAEEHRKNVMTNGTGETATTISATQDAVPAKPTASVRHNGPATYYTATGSADVTASTLIGMRVYAVEADVDETKTYSKDVRKEWDDIGEVNDVVLDWNGGTKAIVLGIGGFLGIGEKDVAVDMASLRKVREADDKNDWFLVVNSSKAALEAAPTYKR